MTTAQDLLAALSAEASGSYARTLAKLWEGTELGALAGRYAKDPESLAIDEIKALHAGVKGLGR